jgi:hypothetical protein
MAQGNKLLARLMAFADAALSGTDPLSVAIGPDKDAASDRRQECRGEVQSAREAVVPEDQGRRERFPTLAWSRGVPLLQKFRPSNRAASAPLRL